MIFQVPSPSGSSMTVPGLDTEENMESRHFLQYFIKLGRGTGIPGVKSQTGLVSICSFSFSFILVGVSAQARPFHEENFVIPSRFLGVWIILEFCQRFATSNED